MANYELGTNNNQNQEPTGWEDVAALANNVKNEQAMNRESEKYDLSTPFGALGDSTLEAIVNTENTHVNDKKFAQIEIDRRKGLDIFNPSSQEDSVMKDLENNFYGISEGRVLVPTDEYREYRTRLLNGENPEHPKGYVRETAEYMQAYHDVEKIVVARDEGKELREDGWGYQESVRYITKEVMQLIPERQKIEENMQQSGNIPNGYILNTLASTTELGDDVVNKCLDYECRRNVYGDIIADYLIDKRNIVLSDEKTKDFIKDSIQKSVTSFGLLSKNEDINFASAQEFLEQYDILKNEDVADDVVDRLHWQRDVSQKEYDKIFDRMTGLIPLCKEKCDPESEKFQEPDNVGYHLGYDAESNELVSINYKDFYSPTGADKFYNKLFVNYPKYAEKFQAAVTRSIENQHAESAREMQGGFSMRDFFAEYGHYTIKDKANYSIETNDEEKNIPRLHIFNASLPDIKINTDGLLQNPENAKEIKEGLLARLEHGVKEQAVEHSWWYNGNKYTSSKQEKTHEVILDRNIYEKVGIDLESDEIKGMAFDTFIDTIQTVNGESSDQAQWLYDNCFSKNPQEFDVKLTAFYNSEACDKGTKAKITRFKKKSDAFQKYLAEAELKEREYKGVVSLEKLQQNSFADTMAEYRRELATQFQNGANEATTLFDKSNSVQKSTEKNIKEQKETKEIPFDFGLEKISTLEKWSNYIEENIPDSNVERFAMKFDVNKDANLALNNPRLYFATIFKCNNQLCAMAESFGNPAAMYVAVGDIDMSPTELVDQIFNNSKDSAVVSGKAKRISHTDSNHIAESLENCYKKAFEYFQGKEVDLDNLYYQGFEGAPE